MPDTAMPMLLHELRLPLAYRLLHGPSKSSRLTAAYGIDDDDLVVHVRIRLGPVDHIVRVWIGPGMEDGVWAAAIRAGSQPLHLYLNRFARNVAHQGNIRVFVYDRHGELRHARRLATATAQSDQDQGDSATCPSASHHTLPSRPPTGIGPHGSDTLRILQRPRQVKEKSGSANIGAHPRHSPAWSPSP